MILSATGHRPTKLGGHAPEVSNKLTRFAVQQLSIRRPNRMITGMALGWDQAVARACLELDIPFVAAVPFDGQHARWPHWAQRIYNELLSRAERVHYVSLGGYAAWKMHARNEWMVDQADSMFALWDGTPDGGTANCIAYARLKERPILNLWDEWIKL